MRFLVMYGAENEMLSYEADDIQSVIDEFNLHFEGDINEIALISSIVGWEDAPKSHLYATCSDGSFFGAADLDIITVPEHLTDADEVEDFIVNHREE